MSAVTQCRAVPGSDRGQVPGRPLLDARVASGVSLCAGSRAGAPLRTRGEFRRLAFAEACASPPVRRLRTASPRCRGSWRWGDAIAAWLLHVTYPAVPLGSSTFHLKLRNLGT